MRRFLVITLWVTATACHDVTGPILPPPTDLFYVLDVSGDPAAPGGVLWTWSPVVDPALEAYRVYSRPSQSNTFALRATTTSTSFHDIGQPDLDYFVVAVNSDGTEGDRGEIVTVDERLRLQAPAALVSTSLDQAVHLAWEDNAFTSAPDGFSKYHVYSASYSLDTGECGTDWGREGTTVAPEFLAGALANGQARCFGVSAESIEGWESLWSPIVADTPRPDARNVVVWANDVDGTRSGFRFFLDGNNDGVASRSELGIVTSGARSDIDFRVVRDLSGTFSLVPVRSGTEVVQYGSGPIADLTSIDIAPLSGYAAAAIPVATGYGYVFKTTANDPYARFGAVRITHVGSEYLILDWSYQTDPGDPQLSVGAGLFTAGGAGLIVKK